MVFSLSTKRGGGSKKQSVKIIISKKRPKGYFFEKTFFLLNFVAQFSTSWIKVFKVNSRPSLIPQSLKFFCEEIELLTFNANLFNRALCLLLSKPISNTNISKLDWENFSVKSFLNLRRKKKKFFQITIRFVLYLPSVCVWHVEYFSGALNRDFNKCWKEWESFSCYFYCSQDHLWLSMCTIFFLQF